MSTLIDLAPAAPAADALSQNHRIALLTARAGLEPELAARYHSDPVSVLAEFGVVAAEPMYLTGNTGAGLVMEDLDRVDTAVTASSFFCTTYEARLVEATCA
ncbi:hypothetical protein ACGFYV_23750 [Streptomyces sp. NPDC048297]|uniref:hypothetical protein n=1 Tax=Streptomyces sp. NPDC048297 TaxID=3365531 RepID=UPI00371818D2